MYKYTIEDLKNAAVKSYSIAEMCRCVGIRPCGGNYKTLNNKIKLHNIDISHFTGKGWNVGMRYKQLCVKKPLCDILKKDSLFSSHSLKNRLISENIKKHKCEICGGEEWNGCIIPIELHHIDGDNTNNELSNIQLLCPNCHSLTDNFRGKKIGGSKKSNLLQLEYNSFKNSDKSIITKTKVEKKKEKKENIKPNLICEHCGGEITGRGIKFCSSECTLAHNRRNIPPLEDILIVFNEMISFVKVGKKFGVSDNTIRKWLKYYNHKVV